MEPVVAGSAAVLVSCIHSLGVCRPGRFQCLDILLRSVSRMLYRLRAARRTGEELYFSGTGMYFGLRIRQKLKLKSVSAYGF